MVFIITEHPNYCPQCSRAFSIPHWPTEKRFAFKDGLPQACNCGAIFRLAHLGEVQDVVDEATMD